MKQNMYKYQQSSSYKKNCMELVMMGDSKSGRSSIANVIFQKMTSQSTKLLGETTQINTYDFKIQKIEFKLHDFPAKCNINEASSQEKMIINNASALIYVISPQSDLSKSIDHLHNIKKYIKENNNNNCSINIITNKKDNNLTQNHDRNQYLLKLKKIMIESSIDLSNIQFHFTSINDSSVFQAFSKILQKVIPCSLSICQLLNYFANHSKVEKVYLFDLITKLYIGHNDEKFYDQLKYDICSEMLDIFIDLSYIYDKSHHQDQSQKMINVKLNYDEDNQIVSLRVMEKFLGLVFIIRESVCDCPYVIEENVMILRKGLCQLLNATMVGLNK